MKKTIITISIVALMGAASASQAVTCIYTGTGKVYCGEEVLRGNLIEYRIVGGVMLKILSIFKGA